MSEIEQFAKDYLDEILAGNEYDLNPSLFEDILVEARKGNQVCRCAVIDVLFYAWSCEWFYSQLEPTDKVWILSQGSKRAAAVFIVGMNNKYSRTLQTSTDVESGETFNYYTYARAEGTLFERDVVQEQQLFMQLQEWSPEQYRDMVTASQLLCGNCTLDIRKIVQKAADEGDSEAACELASLYRAGEEKNGIFADREKAKYYYDIAGEEFDEFEDLNDDFPDEIDYTIAGEADVLCRLCSMIDEICEQQGKPHRPQFSIETAADNELKCLVPLLPLIQKLVGEVDGTYYFGYIMFKKTVDENTILLRIEAKRTSALYYALKLKFPELRVEYKIC